MSKSSIQNQKHVRKAAKTSNKKWLIWIVIGVAVVILIVRIVYFTLPKSKPNNMKLKVEDLVAGTGRKAETGDTLIVDYTGWISGISQPFEKSTLHNKPFEFVLGKGEVIPGWDQGLSGMKVGGTRKLTIPPDLAYGAEGTGRIPPDATLIFEVELLDVITPLAELPPTSVKELNVEELVVGTGTEAKVGNTIRVHYTGWLENGTKFDSSLDKGKPIEFVLGDGQVIAGWEQGLIGMKVGGKRKLTIPPDLGYGAKGLRNYIPQNAALIFEVELLAVK
jgi:FKBP-type peptidyl-prolyl cis-trans isomerase